MLLFNTNVTLVWCAVLITFGKYFLLKCLKNRPSNEFLAHRAILTVRNGPLKQINDAVVQNIRGLIFHL